MSVTVRIPTVLQKLTNGRNELQAGAANNGNVTFLFSTREQVNAAIDALRAEGSEIESVVPTASTLEDVFVKAVEG